MRKSAVALTFVLLATLGVFVPAAAAAAPANVKAVVIVGATHGATSNYRSSADTYVAELKKYTTNVVKIYSPYATWGAVKPALQGASIVIYLGHGNGFPSPYRTTPWPYSQNGFGLNKVSGQGDNNTTYYGEHYIGNEIKLAPNAVVLFNRLCYASGNSEPGHADPTLSVAKQRVDNYAAGFLKAGARAVIADGHGSLVPYLRSLFTTRASILQIWRSAPNYHGHEFQFPSVRSPGYTAVMDPETTNKYYRSLVGNLALQSEDVTGAAYAPTDADPAQFVVPGAASVLAGGAPMFADPALGGTPVASLPADTRLRVDEAVATDTSATGVLKVRTLDGTLAGYADSDALRPRDSAAPEVWELSNGGGEFDPGDPASTGITISGRLSEVATWRIKFRSVDSASVMRHVDGSGSTFSATWSGLVSGVAVPDGSYPWTLEAWDAWGNIMAVRKGAVVADSWNRILAAGASYSALDPIRLLDSREGNGLTGAFVSGTPRTFQVTGRGGVPSDAVAVTGNLTVTGQTSAGYLALGPEPDATPGTSTLNFPLGDTRANGVTVRLGKDGSLSAVFAGLGGAKAHVVFDVTGYFGLGAEAALYSPLGPARLLDTRTGNGLSGSFASGTPRSFLVAGRRDIPKDAVAVTGNLTVTGQTSAGYLALGPVVSAAPDTSTLNFPVGDNRANGLTVRLAEDGTLGAVFVGAAGATAHLVFDVTGYYRAGAGSLFVPLDPDRLLDTRTGNGLTGAFVSAFARSFLVAGRREVPASAVAVTGNLTVTGQQSAGYLSLGPVATSTPQTSTLNFPLGDTRANGVTVPLGTGGTLGNVFLGGTGKRAHVVWDVTGYFKAPAAP